MSKMIALMSILLMMRINMMMMISYLHDLIERSSVHPTVHLTWVSTPSNLPSLLLSLSHSD